MKQISDSSALPLGSSGSEAEPLAKALIEKAIQAFKSNNLQGSVAALDEATRIAPNYHRAWMTKAELMSTLEQKSAAIACYDAALAIKPVRTKPGLGEEVRQVVPFSAKILCG